MGCLWCGKQSRRWKTMPSGPPEFNPPFIPVTGMKCSYGTISSPLTEVSVGKTEISGTEQARPIIWTHRKFYKGFRGEARSRKPGQPGQPGSYEEALKHRTLSTRTSRIGHLTVCILAILFSYLFLLIPEAAHAFFKSFYGLLFSAGDQQGSKHWYLEKVWEKDYSL